MPCSLARLLEAIGNNTFQTTTVENTKCDNFDYHTNIKHTKLFFFLRRMDRLPRSRPTGFMLQKILNFWQSLHLSPGCHPSSKVWSMLLVLLCRVKKVPRIKPCPKTPDWAMHSAIASHRAMVRRMPEADRSIIPMSLAKRLAQPQMVVSIGAADKWAVKKFGQATTAPPWLPLCQGLRRWRRRRHRGQPRRAAAGGTGRRRRRHRGQPRRAAAGSTTSRRARKTRRPRSDRRGLFVTARHVPSSSACKLFLHNVMDLTQNSKVSPLIRLQGSVAFGFGLQDILNRRESWNISDCKSALDL